MCSSQFLLRSVRYYQIVEETIDEKIFEILKEDLSLNINQEGCKDFEPFKYKNLNVFQEKLNELNLDLPIYDDFEVFKESISIKEKRIPNRLAIQPMEGFDSKRDGSPSFLTARRYLRYAKGGAGIIWCEANSISMDYKSNIHQLAITEENVDDYRKFVKFVKVNSKKALEKLEFTSPCLIILQLNHSGRYCKKDGKKYPIRAYPNKELDKAIDALEDEGKIINDNELERLEDIWVKKALLARKAGFDGVDIKACHGYLISELLSARQRKNSKYGGYDLKDRSRFYFNIIKKLKEKISNEKGFFITSRMGIYNGIPYPHGFGIEPKKGEQYPAPIDLTESLSLIKELHKLGIKLINISAGNPHYKPYITRPYDIPIKGKQTPPEHPLCSVYRLIKMTSEIKKSIPQDINIIGSGYSYLRNFAPNICAGLLHNNLVDICGFGRMSFANPNFARQIFENSKISSKNVCITCSQCSQLMRNRRSTGCVIRDKAYEMKT